MSTQSNMLPNASPLNMSSAGQGENFKNSKPGMNNSSGNESGAATAENAATASSHNRCATGPRTWQGKERSKHNALKHGIFDKAKMAR